MILRLISLKSNQFSGVRMGMEEGRKGGALSLSKLSIEFCRQNLHLSCFLAVGIVNAGDQLRFTQDENRRYAEVAVTQYRHAGAARFIVLLRQSKTAHFHPDGS